MNNSLDPVENDFQTTPPIRHAELHNVTKASRKADTPTPATLPFHDLFAKMWHDPEKLDYRVRGYGALSPIQIFQLTDLPSTSSDESTTLSESTHGAVSGPPVTLILPPVMMTSTSNIVASSYGEGELWSYLTALRGSTQNESESPSSPTSITTSTVDTMDTPLSTPSTGAEAGVFVPNPSSSPATLVPSTGPEPASVTTDSSIPQSSQDSTSQGVPGSIVAAIVLPILAVLGLCACLGLWFRRRSKNKKRARELEKRAEWLDPAYVARVRQEMMGLDPSKTSRTDDGGYNSSGNVNELGTVVKPTTDEGTAWTNRGKMSGSLIGHPHNVRPPPRTRTTENGSPVALSRGRRNPLQDSYWDFPLPRNPSESEWFGNNTLPSTQKSSRDSTYAEEPGITALPAPYFDPRGSMRESQIGLALPLPRSLSASRNPYGNLTGDGYEAVWRTARSRSRRSTPGPPQQGLGLGANGDIRMSLQGTDDPEAEESFLSGFSSETTHVGSEAQSHGSDKKVLSPAAQDSSSETAGSVLLTGRGHKETKHATLSKPREEGHRSEVFRGSEEVKASEPTGMGNEDVVRGMLKKRLGLVDGLFGR